MITLLSKVIHRRLDDASALGFRARTRQCRTSEAESSGRASSNPAHNSDLKSGKNDIEKYGEYQCNFIALCSNVSLPYQSFHDHRSYSSADVRRNRRWWRA